MRYRHRLVWLLGVAMVLGYAIPAMAGPGIFFHGDLTDLEATDRPVDQAWGVASATVAGGTTIVVLNVKDVDRLAAGTTFGAHVHVGPCMEGNGAAALGHYHTGLAGALSENEVWLDFTVTNGGTGHATAVVPFEIPAGAARSVVIHALPTDPATGAAGARMACLPLEL